MVGILSFPIGEQKAYFQVQTDMAVSTPKWMVKIMENPIKMDDLGVFPIIFGLETHPYVSFRELG